MYSVYTIRKPYIIAKTVFVPSKFLPKDLPITTPFTFPLYDEKYFLAFDKNGWWNPLGGHVEEGEEKIQKKNMAIYNITMKRIFIRLSKDRDGK